MSIQSTISKINRELIGAFALLDGWFDRDHTFLYEKPEGKWSAAEILEHVMLTNHYLLILIGKGSAKAKALANEQNLEEALKHYQFDVPGIEEIGQHQSFTWDNPAHMTPTGTRSLSDVRNELRDQLYRCMCHLELLGQGEGVLHKTQMSVNSLGKLDVYQYIYFLALHIKRHLGQLESLPGVRQFEASNL